MRTVVYLAPYGATFSHVAYDQVQSKYGGPKLTTEIDRDYVGAETNRDVLRLACAHGAFGVLAMETLIERRVEDSLDGFIDLLDKHEGKYCPIKILGAKRVEINFALMARPGLTIDRVIGVIAHEKAIAPCREKIKARSWKTKTVSSSGKAAEIVATESEYENWAVLGPEVASQKYGLEVLERKFEDGPAVTTFFVIGPSYKRAQVGEKNRLLVVFKVNDTCGALADVLQVFKRNGLNLLHIHSAHIKDGVYHFVIECEFDAEQISAAKWTVTELGLVTKKLLSFGPFVIE
jgi:prephenate dehydratase